MGFPSSIPSNVDPVFNNKLASPSHSALHQSHDAEIVAIETKMGTGASTPTSGKVLRASGTGTSAWAQVDPSTDLTTMSSATLRGLLSDETGTGAAVFATSPALTSPAITTPSVTTSINDSNGNEVLRTPATASAVNDVTITNAATGGTPTISATGDDTNINLTLAPKGSGGIVFTKRYDGWVTGLPTPDTVTAKGNRSYTLNYLGVDLTGYLSNGQRIRTTRTVPAPTQCTSLNGSTQFYNKTTPGGLTFTDDFTGGIYIKPTSYAAGTLISRYNGTSGWALRMNASGQIQLIGYNAGSANFSQVLSSQSVALNKWVHVAAQLDMSTFTATSTSSYIMIDGVDVPAVVSRGGTNPTALVQAGNLEIGSENGGTNSFAGKIAQAAIFSAKVTEATMLGYSTQSYLGTETNLVSAYSFNNTLNDLNTTTANNLTANGSAIATNAGSPFGGQAYTPLNEKISAVFDHAIIQSVTFGVNTAVNVQVAEGCAIPTSGGIAAVDYSPNKAPYGFPTQRVKWRINSIIRVQFTQTSAVSGTWYNLGAHQLNIPIGDYTVTYQCSPLLSATTNMELVTTLSTGATTASDTEFITQSYLTGTALLGGNKSRERPVSVNTATPYFLNHSQQSGTGVTIYNLDAASAGGSVPAIIEAEVANL